jgi:uncharacterized protein YoxC
MPDIQPIDIAIFLVSFAACIYCILLSRRLKSLQDTRDGLGATIMAMNKSVSAISSATLETRAQAGELADRLSRLMKEADESCEKIGSMLDALEQHGEVPHTRKPQALTETGYESGDESSDLEKLISEMRAQQDRLRSVAQNNELLFEEDEAWVTRKSN